MQEHNAPNGDGGFYLVWNPKSTQPSARLFASPEQARAVARHLAEQYSGEQFYVLLAVGVASTKSRDSYREF